MQEVFSENFKNSNFENERKCQIVVSDVKKKLKAKYDKKFEQFRKELEKSFDARLEISHKEIFEKIHSDYENELDQKESLINELKLKNKNLEASGADNQIMLGKLRRTIEDLEKVNHKENFSLNLTNERECQSSIEMKDEEINADFETNEILLIKEFYENNIENLGKKLETVFKSRDSLLKEKDLVIKNLENELDKIYSYMLLI